MKTCNLLRCFEKNHEKDCKYSSDSDILLFLNTFQHPFIYSNETIEFHETGIITIMKFAPKGSLRDVLSNAKVCFVRSLSIYTGRNTLIVTSVDWYPI